MFPMDPHMYQINNASDLSLDKQNIIRQLSDMFCGKSLDKIRGICEECMWNVDLCIDKLVTADDDGSNNPMALNFSEVIQNARGAVRKAGPQLSLQTKQHEKELPGDYVSVYEKIIKGYKVLILMRGAPGSGKSHLAKSIVTKLMPGRDWRDFVLSADDYFIDALGRYKYSLDKLGAAHEYCQTRAREKTALGWSPIIIDNTHIKSWEMMHYVKAAVQNGYIIEIMEPVTPWCKSASVLASKNNHNVPKHKIQRMLNEYDVCTANDCIMMLKETKYTVPLPQLRTYPPPPAPEIEPESPAKVLPQSTNINCEILTDLKQDVSYAGERGSFIAVVDSGNDTWNGYDIPSGEKQTHLPKSPRQCQRSSEETTPMQLEPSESITQNSSTFDQEAANFWGVPVTPPIENTQYKPSITQTQLFPTGPIAWKTYEQEATSYWGLPLTDVSKSQNLEQMNTDQNETCGLLQLLKEGVKSINVPTKENNEGNAENCDFVRHSVGCVNENQIFIELRQIYPNKPIAELWDLFVKCGGSNDWAVDILLKDDDSLSNDDLDYIENRDTYDCGCGNPMTTKSRPVTITPTFELNVKPQRARPPRNRIPTAEILEIKEAVEKSFVLGDEHYSSHVKKIRNKRNLTGDSVANQKSFIDCQVQTEGDDNDTISEEGGDGSEILEIDLGEDLIGQLTKIFKSETTALNVPEKFKTNVFMPKSLARELYLLWMEAAYNQIEEQRQSSLKEDEDFARLLKNPKYENCKQPPENIKELLDMEFAWMVYKSEQEEYQATDIKHQQTNDLASHLTRMKLCELFPNIAKDTLLEVFAAHNNNFSETVEMLKSTIQPAVIDTQTSAIELIEKARNEDEKLSKEVEKQQQEYSQTHSIPVGQLETTSGSSRRRSLSPDEAKRLALKEFEESRNYAAHHCQLRAECYQKAKEAIQRGHSGVAVYYSNIANLHKKKIDIYNHRAANCIMEVHDRTQNNPDFIDLHYLHVIEAIACLDIFVDKHIAKLRSIFRSYKYVFIITGRGLHSTGGVSTIKTRVKSRLKERNLKWSEVNPGLLKVKIFSASKYAKNL